MNKLLSRLAAIAFMGMVIFLASCSSDDDDAKPKPVVTPASSSLTLIQDTTGTIDANISAAAGIKDITVTVDKGVLGAVEITNKADVVGKTVGTATIKFTSSFTLASRYDHNYRNRQCVSGINGRNFCYCYGPSSR